MLQLDRQAVLIEIPWLSRCVVSLVSCAFSFCAVYCTIFEKKVCFQKWPDSSPEPIHLRPHCTHGWRFKRDSTSRGALRHLSLNHMSQGGQNSLVPGAIMSRSGEDLDTIRFIFTKQRKTFRLFSS